MKLVFLDLQNTIAPGITKLNSEALTLISKLETKYRFCLCSTSPISDLKQFLKINNLDWDFIAEGGAFLHTKHFEKTIEFELSPKILINFANDIKFMFYENEGCLYAYNYIESLKGIFPQFTEKVINITNFMNIEKTTYKQIFICIKQVVRNQFVEAMNRKHIRVILIAEDLKNVIYRLVAEGISKSFFFNQVCKYYQITDTIAIGDSIDDLKMFKAAKIKVAVANAVPLVKAEADYVVDTFENNGAFKFLFDYARTL